MTFVKVDRNDLIPLEVEENTAPFTAQQVSQNQPNPFSEKSYVNVDVKESCILTLEVLNITGQVVYSLPARKVNSGSVRLEIRAGDLPSGVYFYSVRAGDTKVTKKMVIE
jgi:hypothetical protein